MHLLRAALASTFLLALCTVSAVASGSALGHAALAPYAGPGTATLFGTIDAARVGQAVYCAPNIPYTRSYISSMVAGFVAHPYQPKIPVLDPALAPYVRIATVAIDHRFTCSGLVGGKYLVFAWIHGNASPVYSTTERLGTLSPNGTNTSNGHSVVVQHIGQSRQYDYVLVSAVDVAAKQTLRTFFHVADGTLASFDPTLH